MVQTDLCFCFFFFGGGARYLVWAKNPPIGIKSFQKSKGLGFDVLYVLVLGNYPSCVFLLSGLTWGVSNQECESIFFFTTIACFNSSMDLGRLIAPKKNLRCVVLLEWIPPKIDSIFQRLGCLPNTKEI